MTARLPRRVDTNNFSDQDGVIQKIDHNNMSCDYDNHDISNLCFISIPYFFAVKLGLNSGIEYCYLYQDQNTLYVSGVEQPFYRKRYSEIFFKKRGENPKNPVDILYDDVLVSFNEGYINNLIGSVLTFSYSPSTETSERYIYAKLRKDTFSR